MKLTFTMKYRPDQLPGDLCIYSQLGRSARLDVFVSVNQSNKTYLLLLANNIVRNGSALSCDEVISYDD